MSNMKHDAIVESGIHVVERVALPVDLIPEDSQVEITAKVAAGYFNDGSIPTSENLANIKGRSWEELLH